MASRYWVGGTAAWDGTAGSKWATTSGGGGGAAVPTTSDDVFLDGNSGANTITLATGAACSTLDCTGFTGTLSHPSLVAMTVAGNLYKLDAGMTFTTTVGGTTARIDFTSTTGTCLITTANQSMCSITFNGAGGTFQLQDGLTTLSTYTVTLTAGTLDTNNQTCSWGVFSSTNSNTRTLTLGSSGITITGTGTVWNTGTVTNLTFNAGTSAITMSANSSNTFAGGGLSYYDVSITGSGTWTMTGTNTFHDLTRSSIVSGTQALAVQNDIVVSNTFTVVGTYTALNAVRINICSAQFSGTAAQRTITVNGSCSFTNVDFHCILAAGSASLPWTGTSMGDGGNNTNITFDAPRTLYWVGAATNWSTLNKWALSSGGAPTTTVPLPQDDCNIDSNSGVGVSNTFSTGLRYMGRNVDFTGVPNAATLTFQLGGFNPGVTGNLTWEAGMTLTSSAVGGMNMLFFDNRDVTLTTAGISSAANWRWTFTGTGSITLGDDLTMADLLTYNMGTFNANNKNVTVANFTAGVAATRVLNMGNGTWTLTGTGDVWNIDNEGTCTINCGTSTIIMNNTAASQKRFDGGSKTYHNIVFDGGDTLLIQNADNVCNNFTLNGVNTKTLMFENGVRNLIVSGTLTLDGSGGAITCRSTSVGTLSFIVVNGTAVASYTTFQDVSANGAASIWAVDNCTDGGNNHNIIFIQPTRLTVGGVG